MANSLWQTSMLSKKFKDELLLLDLTVAYNLGAPQGHTISSYAHMKQPLFALLIDAGFELLGQKNHCKKSYESAIERIKKYGP